MPSKKKQATKKPQKSEPEPPKPEPEPVQAAAESEERHPEVELQESFSATLAQIQVQQQQLTALKNQVRTLEKQALRELKLALKANRRNKRKASTQEPSGSLSHARLASSWLRSWGSLLEQPWQEPR